MVQIRLCSISISVVRLMRQCRSCGRTLNTLKLQRSAADGKVFDRIDAVYDRYVAGSLERNSIEVWKFNRQVPMVPAGTLLRIQADKPFLLHWTSDEWQSSTDTRSTATALGIDFVDIQVPDRDGPIRFTFLWTEENRWEGKDYDRQNSARHDRKSTVPDTVKKVLVLDIGGTFVKIYAPGHERLEIKSGSQKMTPETISQGGKKKQPMVGSTTRFRSVIRDRFRKESLTKDPANLRQRLGGIPISTKRSASPLKIINDAAMQALGTYRGGRMLFLGLGTGLAQR